MEAIQKQRFGDITAKELHIRIPDDIHKDLNKLAKKEKKSISFVVTELLQQALESRVSRSKKLEIIKQKIEAIQQDLSQAVGLTQEEAEIAAEVGLIADGQKWWWTEAWQEGEREVEEDIKAGRVSPPMTVEEMRKYFGST
jgi:predicted transcriptional regulator